MKKIPVIEKLKKNVGLSEKFSFKEVSVDDKKNFVRNILNHAISNGWFSDSLKEANIIPVYKKEDLKGVYLFKTIVVIRLWLDILVSFFDDFIFQISFTIMSLWTYNIDRGSTESR